MPTKFITFKYSKSVDVQAEYTTPILPKTTDKLAGLLEDARLSIQKISSDKTASFLQVYLQDPDLTPSSSPATFLNNLQRFQSINAETEQQWKEDAYGTVNVLKTWRMLFKALDHRKRYLRRMKRDSANQNVPKTNETPDTEEQGEEGSLEEDAEANSEEREDIEDPPEPVDEATRKRRRAK